jgi:glycosyltransferase involved in cell wall biosynthesis
LARYHDVNYYFFSAGDEWYWQQQHGVQTGKFHYVYLPGRRIAGTRITPTLAWKLWRTPYDVYIKCINGRFALPVTFAIAKLRRKPFILWTGIWQRLDTPAHRLFLPLTRLILRSADAVVVYGNHVKRFLVEEGVEPSRVFIADHAVDNAQYNRTVPTEEVEALRRELRIPNGHQVVLYLGRLEPVKGLEYLLDAFAELTLANATLVLVGTGTIEAELKMRTAQLHVPDRIRFTGYMPANQTDRYYALASVFVLPSVTTPTSKETWGLVVNEAFNQGVPVIATDAVGAAAGGLVRHGENGLIVPERNSQALTDALHLILSQPALRQAMSRAARTCIEHWDNERMVAGFRAAIAYVTKQTTAGKG